jgi:hypothetical protein
MRKLLQPEGYTITCTSWENDGDNYNILSVHTESLEKAQALKQLCLLCQSKYNRNGVKSIGNHMEFDDYYKAIVLCFMKTYPVLSEFGNHTDDYLITRFGDIIALC